MWKIIFCRSDMKNIYKATTTEQVMAPFSLPQFKEIWCTFLFFCYLLKFKVTLCGI
ncbi:hypothetical protein PVAP13_3KG267182 [Panicum virgatum]|uniref:Uncharacterized protein n=1 Tax=Panicum virgatum TaxID=38727 RepID=A0A8T0UYS6_PANVG|nr:hypothetical protein PVAP13_3KG267182 [Panicum virgatum]